MRQRVRCVAIEHHRLTPTVARQWDDIGTRLAADPIDSIAAARRQWPADEAGAVRTSEKTEQMKGQQAHRQRATAGASNMNLCSGMNE